MVYNDDIMAMPLEKAKKVLQAYKEHNYNARKALPTVGYSGNNARANGGRTIDTAVNRLAQSGNKNEILEYLGMTRKNIAEEYTKVIKQDKNYPAKLRALEPLLKHEGIQWDETKQITTVPVLNLTVSDNSTAQQSQTDANVAQDILCDTDNTAIDKDNIEKK